MSPAEEGHEPDGHLAEVGGQSGKRRVILDPWQPRKWWRRGITSSTTHLESHQHWL